MELYPCDKGCGRDMTWPGTCDECAWHDRTELAEATASDRIEEWHKAEDLADQIGTDASSVATLGRENEGEWSDLTQKGFQVKRRKVQPDEDFGKATFVYAKRVAPPRPKRANKRRKPKISERLEAAEARIGELEGERDDLLQTVNDLRAELLETYRVLARRQLDPSGNAKENAMHFQAFLQNQAIMVWNEKTDEVFDLDPLTVCVNGNCIQVSAED